MLKSLRWAKVVTGLVAVPVILWLLGATFVASLFGGSPFDNNPFDDLPFNRAHWIEDESVVDGSNRRGHMAEDIINQLKVGTPKQDVYKMLGKGEEVYVASTPKEDRYPSKVYLSSGTSRNPNVAKVLHYYLGEELAMAWGINTAELRFYLDNQDRYVGYEIGTYKDLAVDPR